MRPRRPNHYLTDFKFSVSNLLRTIFDTFFDQSLDLSRASLDRPGGEKYDFWHVFLENQVGKHRSDLKNIGIT